jgi:hypothetical protein
MATEAARLKRKTPQGGKRKTDLTLTGLLMEGLSPSSLHRGLMARLISNIGIN